MATALQKACPVLPASDVPETLAGYHDKLGFDVDLDRGDYGIVQRDAIEIQFRHCDQRPVVEHSSCSIRVADADAVYATMVEAAEGGRISPPADHDRQTREFYVWDPNGNLLRFGQCGARIPIA